MVVNAGFHIFTFYLVSYMVISTLSRGHCPGSKTPAFGLFNFVEDISLISVSVNTPACECLLLYEDRVEMDKTALCLPQYAFYCICLHKEVIGGRKYFGEGA